MDWLKLWNGAHLDAVFPAIADMAGSTVGAAQGTYFALAEYANEREERGSIAGYERLLPVIASYQRVAVDEVKRIVAALVELGKIIGDRISAFAKRNTEVRSSVRGTANSGPSPAVVWSTTDERTPAQTRDAIRMRDKRKRDPRQREMLLVVGRNRSEQPEHPCREQREQPEQRSPQPVEIACEHPAPREREREIDKGSFKKVGAVLSGGASKGRDKAAAKEALRAKLIRYAQARLPAPVASRMIEGLLGSGSNPQQFYFDRLDRMMREEGWDDRRAA